jgi:hypothetical protein
MAVVHGVTSGQTLTADFTCLLVAAVPAGLAQTAELQDVTDYYIPVTVQRTHANIKTLWLFQLEWYQQIVDFQLYVTKEETAYLTNIHAKQHTDLQAAPA